MLLGIDAAVAAGRRGESGCMTVVPPHSVGPAAVMHGGGAGGGFGANKDDTTKEPLEVTIFALAIQPR